MSRRKIPLEVAAAIDTGALRETVAGLVVGALERPLHRNELLRAVRLHLAKDLPSFLIDTTLGEALGELFNGRAIGTRGEFEERLYFRRHPGGETAGSRAPLKGG
jgi:hypothetical protein